MKETNFIIDEVLMIVTLINTAMIVSDFIRSKDGELRKIMIAYFCVELWILGCAIVYMCLSYYDIAPVRVGMFLAMLIAPKFVVKVWLRRWQIKNKNRKKVP